MEAASSPSSDRARQAYRMAFVDWLACAHAGGSEPPVAAIRAAGAGLLERVVAAGAAGHILDFDDTYVPGLAHISAAVAPATLAVAAEVGADSRSMLDAFAAGFEATAAVSAASYPMLYDNGWHASSVCGVVGAAIASARLMELDAEEGDAAVNLALLGAAGLRSAFGSHGKALQVGMAAASGVRGAMLAAAGATAPSSVRSGPASFEDAYGGTWAEPDPSRAAVLDNWIKRYPCCLQTHAPIEAAGEARGQGAGAPGRGEVRVHPVSRQAARFDQVDTALQAKFSIPYLVAFTLLHGPPDRADLDDLDAASRSLARDVTVRVDPALDESEAHLRWSDRGGEFRTHVVSPIGSPRRPLPPEEFATKVARLTAGRLSPGVLDTVVDAADLLDVVAQ